MSRGADRLAYFTPGQHVDDLVDFHEAGIGDEVVAMLWKPLSNPEIEPNRKLSTTQAA